MVVRMLRSTFSGLLLLVGAAAAVGGSASVVQLPNVTGRYPVGTVSLELIDAARRDPFAPGPQPQPRDLMVSVYYPTTSAVAARTGGSSYSFAPYMSAEEAAALADTLGTSPDIPTILTQAYSGAPLLRRNASWPVLLFSPGFGGSRKMYAAQLADLASQGWVVVAVDHPYDAMIVAYPDGRSVHWLGASTLDDFPSQMPKFIDVRVADVAFVARSLKNATVLAQIPGIVGGSGTNSTASPPPFLRTDRMGLLGHSLGGATAAQALAKTSDSFLATTFPCGANLDGGVWGPVVQTGLSRPFLLVQAEADVDVDAGLGNWASFWPRVRGFRRLFRVNGTEHLSFSDAPVLRDLVGGAGQRNTSGTLTGKRDVEIGTALLDRFFAYCLKNQPAAALDGLAGGRFPEVVALSSP